MKLPKIRKEMVRATSYGDTVRVFRYRTWEDGSSSAFYLNQKGVWTPFGSGLDPVPPDCSLPLS